MFVGAILASATNLIFVGLVKSGEQLNDVQIQVGTEKYTAQVDEVGYWKANIPSQVLAQSQEIDVKASYAKSDESVIVNLPYLVQNNQQSVMQLLPITSNNTISEKEKNGSLVIRGQYFGQPLTEQQKIVVSLDDEKFDAKLDKNGMFSTAIDAKKLVNSSSKNITAAIVENDQQSSQVQHAYSVDTSAQKNTLDIDLQPIPAIDSNSNGSVEISGKVVKPYSTGWLYFAIIVDNLASGLAGAAFIAFLSSLTSVSFTAVQYAIFSSLMTLTPKILGGYSGTIVTNIGYPNFFLMTTLIGIPILVLVVWVGVLLKNHQKLTVKEGE